jgi:SAM-dependent methyltransferase
MSTGYAIAYRLGLTPWEQAGRGGAEQLTALFAREEEGRTAPFGAALDLGCGTGAHSVELARRGWQVTGVDAIGAAVDKARARARDEGVDVRFVQGDVTALRPEDVGTDVRFFLDVGCFHGLKDDERAAMGERVTACAAPDATLLMLAFPPGRRGPLPRGAGRADIGTAFAGWVVAEELAADVAGMPGPLKKAAPRWYRLRRG